jgi:uncharacterized protein (TIGR03032 family)
MAMHGGIPVYATALGHGNAAQSWRTTLPNGGVLIRVPDNEIVATGLPMPHSPRVWSDGLWMLFSSTGEVVRVDQASGQHEVVARLDGFARGFARHGKYLFVGLSRLRENSFKGLAVGNRATAARIVIVDAHSASIVGELEYQSTVEEIFDIAVLEGQIRPGIINSESDAAPRSLVTPYGTYWAQPVESETDQSRPGVQT